MLGMLLLGGCAPVQRVDTARSLRASSPGAATVNAAAGHVSAKSLVLTAADYPEGWETQARPQDHAGVESAKRMAHCFGFRDPDLAETADAEGVYASRPGGGQAHSSAVIYRTERDARDDVLIVDRHNFVSCSSGEIKRIVQERGGLLVSVNFYRLPTAQYGDETRATRTVFAVTFPGSPVVVTYYADTIEIGAGRTVLDLSLSGPSPFEPEVESALLAKLASKL